MTQGAVPPRALIAIAGPSCSGKSLLADAIAAKLGPRRCVIVRQDDFYRDLAHLPMEVRAGVNFDSPTAIDRRAMIAVAARLLAGRTAATPAYDFVEHCRRGEMRWLEPAPLVIVEGTMALRWVALRRMARLRVYVDAPLELCLQRRVDRDVAERGRTEGSVIAQWRRTVAPMHRRYVLPQARHADMIVSGLRADEAATAVVSALSAVRRST